MNRITRELSSSEVGVEIAPQLVAGSVDAGLADRIDSLLRRACRLARALTGAEQAALKLWVDEDPTKARKYFSLSEKYSDFGEFRVDPKALACTAWRYRRVRSCA